MSKQENTENGITAKQSKAISALLTSRTIGEAATSAGVAERTLYTWLKNADFRGALREAQNELLDTTTRRLANGQTAALDTMEKLIQSARHESTRLTACVQWVNLFLRFNEVKNIEERLTELERQVQNGGK
ncbi:MAG: hypothetical protein B6D40_06750 [Anaerolineae bacterium UTCFX3]|jgi:hypothetical protein|nr:MAG: hypothetical protein B6D40_06750 [Anaerolineae bacterium UTCFX3]